MSGNERDESRRRFVLVHLPSVCTLPTCIEQIDAAIEECRKSGLREILFDATGLKGPIPIIDLYEIGDYMCSQIAPTPIRRIAILTGSAITQEDRFFEDVVRNRGLDLRWFSDRDEMTQWLLPGNTNTGSGLPPAGRDHKRQGGP